METLDEFLKTDEERLEEDSQKVLSILRLSNGSVVVQGACSKGDPKVTGYFGFDRVRLREALLYLRRKGLLRYGSVDETDEAHRGTPRFGRLYFWVRLTPAYRKSLQVSEVTV